jgi:hypothetical protein
MDTTFNVVYQALLWLSAATGFSYKEVNVIIYFFLAPLTFIFLIDRILKTWVLSVCFLIASIAFLLWIPSFSAFSEAAFDTSVRFLNGFSKVGWNYTQASVIICVILPALVFTALAVCALATKSRARSSMPSKRTV